MAVRDELEVWKNVGAGMAWIIVLNPMGSEDSKTVRGGQTFTISPRERQINQYAAASAEQDLFRNGRFVLLKASNETQTDEIESTQSLTDAEIVEIVHEIMADNSTIDRVVKAITSPVTLQRLQEELALTDNIPEKVTKVLRQSIRVATGTENVAQGEVVNPEPVKKPMEKPVKA